MKRWSFFVAVVLVVTLLSTQGFAVLDEQKQPTRKFWRLGFKHTGLHYVRVGGRAVAYTTYQVTNNTGAAIVFTPIFRVETETNRVTYGKPDAGVAELIRRKHQLDLLDINQITGVIGDGESKLGLAVFSELDPSADHVKLFVKGLTNAYRYQDEEKRRGYERQEWLVHWFRPGDAQDRPDDRVDTLFDSWVWRSTATGTTRPVNE